MSLENLTDAEVIHKLEQKFGRDLSHIVPTGTDSHGNRTFDCLDISAEAVLTVDNDGYVSSRARGSKFADILGHI
jgi:hypothetical protein